MTISRVLHRRAAFRVGIAAVAALAMLPATASAADFAVNTTADHPEDKFCNTAPGDCTLRDAVSLAGDADRVIVPVGTYTLSALGELALNGEDLAGAGPRTTIIQATESRVIRAGSGTSTIAGVTIR